MKAVFCDFLGQVGKCGVFVGYGEQSRCNRHLNAKERHLIKKIGKYSGPSKYQEETGSWQGFKRGSN